MWETESSDFIMISDFFALHKPHFSDFFKMQIECIVKHIFSGISDYFRLFLTDMLSHPWVDSILRAFRKILINWSAAVLDKTTTMIDITP